MNIQAMMKQAQKLQKEMMNEKEKIDNKEFIGKSSFVTVTLKGTKEVKNISIENKQLDESEVEMLEDMLVVAFNDAIKQIDLETEQNMGKYAKGMPGLF